MLKLFKRSRVYNPLEDLSSVESDSLLFLRETEWPHLSGTKNTKWDPPDVAVQALSMPRVTNDPKFFKKVKKARKPEKLFTYKMPKGYHLTYDQKNELTKVLDLFVRREFKTKDKETT